MTAIVSLCMCVHLCAITTIVSLCWCVHSDRIAAHVCAAIISLCSCVQLQRSYRCVGATAIVSLVGVAAITSLYFCLPGFVQYRSIHTQAPAHRLCQFPHRVCVLAMASTHTEAATLASEVSVFLIYSAINSLALIAAIESLVLQRSNHWYCNDSIVCFSVL